MAYGLHQSVSRINESRKFHRPQVSHKAHPTEKSAPFLPVFPDQPSQKSKSQKSCPKKDCHGISKAHKSLYFLLKKKNNPSQKKGTSKKDPQSSKQFPSVFGPAGELHHQSPHRNHSEEYLQWVGNPCYAQSNAISRRSHCASQKNPWTCGSFAQNPCGKRKKIQIHYQIHQKHTVNINGTLQLHSAVLHSAIFHLHFSLTPKELREALMYLFIININAFIICQNVVHSRFIHRRKATKKAGQQRPA